MILSGYSLETVNTPKELKIGERVTVTEGPLKGFKVDILSQNNQNTFLVSFDTLGQCIKIEIPHHILKKGS